MGEKLTKEELFERVPDDQQSLKTSLSIFSENLERFKSIDDLNEHARTMVMLYIGLVHGINGKDFCDDFLKGALQDKKRPVVTPERRH